MEDNLLSEGAQRVTDGHYGLHASLYITMEIKGNTLMQMFELQLHDIEEPLKLDLKLGPACEVLVQHDGVWEQYDDYLDQLGSAQLVRWNNPTPTLAYVRTIQMLNSQRAAKEEKEEGERKVREAKEAQRILEEKIAAIKTTFPLFNSRFPPETRQKIWDYIMETPSVIRPYGYKSNGSLSAGYGDAGESPKNLKIIQVSQRVRDEAAYRLYRNTTFAFPEPQALECFLNKTSSKTLQTIRKMEISFDHADFFRVFGAWELVEDEHHLQWREFGPVLPNLQKIGLGKLTIRLPHHGLLWRYGWGGGCHFVVCKWVLKAVKDAMARYPKVILAIKVDRLSEMQRAELDVILSAEVTPSYEALSDGTLTL